MAVRGGEMAVQTVRDVRGQDELVGPRREASSAVTGNNGYVNNNKIS